MKAKNIGEYSSFFSKFSKFNGRGYADSINLIGEIDKFDDIIDVSKALKVSNVSKESAQAALKYSKFSSDTTGISAALSGLSNAGKAGSGAISELGTSFKGLLGIMSPILPFLALLGTAFAGISAFKWIDEQFVLTFDTALAHAKNSVDAYNQTSAQIEELNSKLQTTQTRIEELKSKGPLTLVEQQELDTLERQNTLLSSQSLIQQQLAVKQKEQAAKDTKKALNFKSESIASKDKDGNIRTSLSGDVVKTKVSRYDYIDNQIGELINAQTLLKESQEQLENDALDSTTKSKLKTDIKNYEASISDYKQNILSTIASMNEEASAGFYLDDGTLLPGYEDDVKKLNEWTDKVAEATGGLSSKQKDSMNKLWENDSLAQAQQSIVSALRNGEDITVDSITAQFPGLAAACDAAGISVEGLLNELQILASQEGAATVLEQAFEATSSAIQKATDNLTTLNSLLKESTSGSGISADGVAAFREMFGENADSALEKTANGYHINQEALEGLQQQQGALLKSDYLSTLNDQYTQLQSIQEEIIAAYERLDQTIEGTSHSALDFLVGGREGCDSYRQHIPVGRPFNTNLVNSVLVENDLANFVLPMQSYATYKYKVIDYL